MLRNFFQGPSTSRQSVNETLNGTKNKKSEDPYLNVEWTWEKPKGGAFIHLSNHDKDVKFHKVYSSGTAVVRSTQPMSNDQFFWELKMISPVYGTDMMVGVGTTEADISQVHDQFVSLLGSTLQSWGLSYNGLFHHNGQSHAYSGRFGQGTIIGVHLDLWNGTLSFYKNKKYLGIASRGLKGKTLYAMASSTAACSAMRIIRSCSFPSSLQYLCCAKLRELIPDEKHVLRALPLPPGLSQFLNKNLGWLMGPRLMESCPQSSTYRTSLSLALKSDSRDPVLSSVHTDESESEEFDYAIGETREVVMLGSRPAILRGAHRPRPRNAILKIQDEIEPESSNCYEPMSSRVSDLHEPLTLRESSELREAPNFSKSSVLREPMSLRESLSLPADIGRTFEMIGMDDEEEDEEEFDHLYGERPAKRLRSSYNYIMGLSDCEDNE